MNGKSPFKFVFDGVLTNYNVILKIKMKNFIKINEKLYPMSNTLVNHIKDSEVVYQLSVKKKKNIFIIDQNIFATLFISLKPILKTGYCYAVLNSRRSLRISNSLYK